MTTVIIKKQTKASKTIHIGSKDVIAIINEYYKQKRIAENKELLKRLKKMFGYMFDEEYRKSKRVKRK